MFSNWPIFMCDVIIILDCRPTHHQFEPIPFPNQNYMILHWRSMPYSTLCRTVLYAVQYSMLYSTLCCTVLYAVQYSMPYSTLCRTVLNSLARRTHVHPILSKARVQSLFNYASVKTKNGSPILWRSVIITRRSTIKDISTASSTNSIYGKSSHVSRRTSRMSLQIYSHKLMAL